MMDTFRKYTRQDEKHEDIEPTNAIESRDESDDSSSVEPGLGAKTQGLSPRWLLFRMDIRIVTLVTLAYLLSYIDRANVGNARIMNGGTGNSMLQELHMSSTQFQQMQTVFIVTYSIFDIPSNIVLKRVKPSWLFAFLLFCWSVLTIGFGGVKNFGEACAVRALIGVFEAGLYPGIMYYFTFWYRIEEYTLRNAFVLDSGALAGAFGGLIAYGVSFMNGISGLSGWNWLFILEGCISVVAAVLLLFCLPNRPEEAKFLSEAERAVAIKRVKDQEIAEVDQPATRWQRAVSWRYLAHYLCYFCAASTLSTLSTFLPTIVSGLGYTDIDAQLYTVPPYAAAWGFGLVVAYVSDRTNKRGVASFITSLIGAAGFLASGILPADAFNARYGCLFVAALGAFAFVPCSSSWAVSNVRDPSEKSLIIALNNSFGGGGQIVGLWIIKQSEANIGYPTGFYTSAGLCFVLAVITGALLIYYHGQNKELRLRGDARKPWAL